MKSENLIKMNFNAAKADAQKLEDIARMLDSTVDKDLEDSMTELSRAWSGTNASMFLGKEDKIGADIKQTAADLKNVAADIRSTAKRIYDAEMNALRIARERAAAAAAAAAAKEATNHTSTGPGFSGGGGGGGRGW